MQDEQRCHWCRRRRPCRFSPLGKPTCAGCWHSLRYHDDLGYVRCAECQVLTDAPVGDEQAPGVAGLGVDETDRCDRCGALPPPRFAAD